MYRVRGQDPVRIGAIVRDASHGFTPQMIPKRGKEVFQNVCAICHDYDGQA